MTVPSTVTKVSYTGDGVTYNWPITFNISGITSSEVEVYLVDVASEISTLLESNYSVDLAVPEVIYPVSGDPITSDYQILLVRKLQLTQDTDYKNQGSLPAETIEEGSDRVVMMIQQLQEQIDRTIKADISQGEATLDEVTAAAAANAAAAAASAIEAATSVTVAEAAQSAAEDARDEAETFRDECQALAGFEAASQVDAEGATDNTKFMTALRVKQEVEYPGAVSIPAANLPTADTIPAGLIAMWSGAIANVPSGWYFCDGTNGTPDLRDRMIMGATQDDSGTPKTTVSGALTQIGGEASHLLTAAESGLPAHTHSYSRGNITTQNRDTQYPAQWAESYATVNTNPNTAQAASQSHNILNPYYALAFIMKA